MLTVALMAFAGVANAETFSLADLIAGDDISIGDKIFSDFAVECQSGTCDEDTIASNTTVEAFIDDGVYFLEFGGAGLLFGADVDFHLEFTVTATAGLLTMIDQAIGVQSTGNQTGTVSVQETVLNGLEIVAQSNINQLDVSDPPAEIFPLDDLIIDPGLMTVDVVKDININLDEDCRDQAGAPCTGNIGTTFLRQSFHQQVPEPTTLILLGTGLAGLAIWRKRSN
jgi:hypothetical protein